MNIAILGADSFIGKNLTYDFSRAEDHTVYAFSRTFNSKIWQDLKKENNLHKIPFDFTNVSSYQNLSIWKDITHIICLISSSKSVTFNQQPTREIFANLIPYTYFLEFLQGNFKGHLIFISSGGTVYGRIKGHNKITENVIPKPISSYGMGKLAIEMLIRSVALHSCFDYTILRLSNPIGRWQVTQSEQGVVPMILNSIIQEKPLHVFGNGLAVRDYFDVKEIFPGIKQLINNPSAWNETYNFGSGVGHTIHDVIALVHKVTNKIINIEYIPERTFDIPYNVLDCSKLLAAIQWNPNDAITGAIRDSWEAIILHKGRN